MEALPPAYRFVGVLSAVYALVMGAFLALIIAVPLTPAQMDAVKWLAAGTFVLSPLALLLGGVLLFTKTTATLRAARWVLAFAGLLLLVKAFVVTCVIVEEYRKPDGSLILIWVPILVMPAPIWGVVVLLTSFFLARRLPPSS
jgi:hypothetical protein